MLAFLACFVLAFALTIPATSSIARSTSPPAYESQAVTTTSMNGGLVSFTALFASTGSTSSDRIDAIFTNTGAPATSAKFEVSPHTRDLAMVSVDDVNGNTSRYSPKNITPTAYIAAWANARYIQTAVSASWTERTSATSVLLAKADHRPISLVTITAGKKHQYDYTITADQTSPTTLIE